MSRKLTVAVIALCVGISAGYLTAASGGAATAERKDCKDVVIPNYTRTYDLHANGVSCGKARKVARARLEDDGAEGSKYFGFSCRNTGNGIRCHKGKRQHVAWHF